MSDNHDDHGHDDDHEHDGADPHDAIAVTRVTLNDTRVTLKSGTRE